MERYVLISVNERKILNPNYFDTIDEAQAEMEKRVSQIVKSSDNDVEFGINFGEAYVTNSHFYYGDGNWDFAICQVE